MPYTEAVLMEIMRISNVTPLTVPHCAMNDTQLQGFTIPKVKIIFEFLYKISLEKLIYLFLKIWYFRELCLASTSARLTKMTQLGKIRKISGLSVTWIKTES
jgi:hypothetical protein